MSQKKKIACTDTPTVDELRRAIPKHCFEKSVIISFGYLFRDILYVSTLIFGALHIHCIHSVTLRILAWAVYGFLQGLVGTGVWILAHECGHGAFTSNTTLNDTFGWILHSILLVPYFSWKITHARHHRYTGHMEKDTAFVPLTEDAFAKKNGMQIEDIGGLMQDTPLKTLAHLIAHQLFGWQLYLFTYETGGANSLPDGAIATKGTVSHFDPHGPIFTRKQRTAILLSDLGILAMIGILVYAGRMIGFFNMIGLYLVPYLWVHHWLVAITYLHHTHPEIPHYAASAWSFKKGALGTVDRSFGFIGRHFFHDIIDHHVITTMESPTNTEILSIFGKLSETPSGYFAFFDNVDDDVEWEITGQNALSGLWRSKAEFMNTVWLPIINLISEPGPVLEVVSPESIMRNEDGWTAIELKTVGTRTKLGNRLYDQHYCWHCKFNSAKKISQVRAFIDSSTAEAVLSDEKFRQQAQTLRPNDEMTIGGPSYPDIPFDPMVKRFLSEFYLLTDAPSETENYVECFTPEASVFIGARSIQGREGIRHLRSSMWDTVKQRTHRPKQVFPYGPNSNLVTILGAVDYVFKDDTKKTIAWAATCEFVKSDKVYLDRYQVFLADDAAWKS
ncbi:oleate delta-12 desaturase [Penicillium malachiteum]|uniref:Oleate delta-12 desaturase n=1 Tax=Penicillium malachiteum TaxID=1324776 RepID=A0AAD6MPY4_9EURO|nr:oleate delta-12 desaturase [Penicillium malachiteum]